VKRSRHFSFYKRERKEKCAKEKRSSRSAPPASIFGNIPRALNFETMNAPSKANNPTRIIALVLLSLSAVSMAGNALTWWQTRMQLTSHVIPRSTVDVLSLPYLYTAIGTAFLVLPAFICYRLKWYLTCAIASGTALIGQELYLLYRLDL